MAPAEKILLKSLAGLADRYLKQRSYNGLDGLPNMRAARDPHDPTRPDLLRSLLASRN